MALIHCCPLGSWADCEADAECAPQAMEASWMICGDGDLFWHETGCGEEAVHSGDRQSYQAVSGLIFALHTLVKLLSLAYTHRVHISIGRVQNNS